MRILLVVTPHASHLTCGSIVAWMERSGIRDCPGHPRIPLRSIQATELEYVTLLGHIEQPMHGRPDRAKMGALRMFTFFLP